MTRHWLAPARAILAALAVAVLAAPCLAASLNEGIIQLRQGDVSAALASFAALVEEDPTDLAASFWLGRAQLEAGQHQAAVASLLKVTNALLDSAEARYWLGMAYLRWGHAGEARAQLEAVLKLDPDYAEAREALARVPVGIVPEASQTLHPPPSAPDGVRVVFEPGALPVDVGQVDLLSSNVYDYTFSDAPTDWFARSGLWAITNRWTCSPQWSWQGGFQADGAAVLWNKREFAGDVTVEGYFAFKMGMGEVHSYKNPTDLNITICGDGANPSSGYSFLVGAGGNTETRIMKGTQVLASTSDPAALLPIFEDGYPSTYEFHRKWWAVRACKQGGKLKLYLDEKLVAQAEDPDPVHLGRVALWTYDNGIIISRVKLYFQREQTQRRPVPGEELIKPALTTLVDLPFAVTCSTHPTVANDFEAGAGSWKPQDERHPAVLRLVEPGVHDAGHCLAVTNPVSGGAFGTTIIPGQFVVDELPRLSFNYRLPADGNARVNLYLDIADQTYEIVFSGPQSGSPRAAQLGAIPGVTADGRWHHAEFDLLGALRDAVGGQGQIKAGNLWIGNLCEQDYLMAGFGGNHLGTTYHLDNFSLDRPGGRDIKLAFTPRRGVKLTGYSVALDDAPLGDAPQTVQTEDPSVSLTAPGGGAWYAHLRARLEDGTWSPTSTLRIRVDEQPPAVADISPAPGTALQDGAITVRLADEGSSGVDRASLRLAVNGTAVPLDGQAASYDPAAGVLTVDPRPLLSQTKDSALVKLSLGPVKDRAGNAMAAAQEWAYTLSRAGDTTPPPAPELRLGPDGYVCNEGFETSLGEFIAYGGTSGARLSLDDSTASSGRRSLRIYNPVEGGRFGILRRGAFDAGRNRILRFDYKVPSRLRVDLAVYVNGAMKGIKFKDRDNNLPIIGAVPDVKDDNQWHTAEINLYEMLRRDDPTAAGYVVDQLVLADWNWKANVKGQIYHLDNFQIIPVLSGLQGLPVAWRAPDISGILGLAWLTDPAPDKDAPRELMLPGDRGVLKKDVSLDGWLYARVQDGAGNWGDTARTRLLVDSQAPAAEALSPPEGAPAATSAVELKLADAGLAGIDPSTVVLSVAGADYTVKNRGMGGLYYDSAAGKLVWNCEQVTPQPVVLPDKQAVPVALKAAKDYAGNTVAALPQWSWTMDYSRDKTAPTVAELRSATHRTLITNTFEDGLADWANRGGGSGAAVALDSTTAASGKSSVKLTQQKAGGNMAALVIGQPFQADSYSVVSFDYRIPSNVKLDLMARLADGNEYAIALTDNPTGAISRVPGIRADGTWRHASFELEPILRQKQARGSLDVQYVYLADRNSMDNPVGASAWFDNFVVGMVGTRSPVLRWKATDTTGIAGYSYALDRLPGTVPPETSKGAALSFSQAGNLDRGRWYFHIRALDGAGNWGPPAHYALLHLTAD